MFVALEGLDASIAKTRYIILCYTILCYSMLCYAIYYTILLIIIKIIIYNIIDNKRDCKIHAW